MFIVLIKGKGCTQSDLSLELGSINKQNTTLSWINIFEPDMSQLKKGVDWSLTCNGKQQLEAAAKTCNALGIKSELHRLIPYRLDNWVCLCSSTAVPPSDGSC
ncbi:hypothetical protein ILYODFUR_033468 [Ilyodon furcidens]|uniref:SRCR domain-containing protein n=1 Tax=Ilyodon furcidens TaxID=33524 RepID=A0ABV0T2D3_9TELE